jgi:hypothetical protein
LLVPPVVVVAIKVPQGTAYMCMKCGLPYQWQGNPPRLVVTSPLPIDDDDDD